jgi:hypothetical protein
MLNVRLRKYPSVFLPCTIFAPRSIYNWNIVEKWRLNTQFNIVFYNKIYTIKKGILVKKITGRIDLQYKIIITKYLNIAMCISTLHHISARKGSSKVNILLKYCWKVTLKHPYTQERNYTYKYTSITKCLTYSSREM